MLIVRKEQMDFLRQAAAKRFEDEMVAHSLNFSPEHCTALGKTQVRLAVRAAMVRAGSYGFDNRGPLRLFIEIMYLFGSACDTDPQYPWAAAILRDTSDQMERAEQLYEQVLDYQSSVPATGAINSRQALTRLSFLPRQSLTFSTDDFITGMLRELTYIFPKKSSLCWRRSASGAYLRKLCLGTRNACR